MTGPLLELWQAEWCPECQRVRQRLTELGVPFIARQVPAAPEQRDELAAATGGRSIPALFADGHVIGGEREILEFLDVRFTEPRGAAAHRERARSSGRSAAS